MPSGASVIQTVPIIAPNTSHGGASSSFADGGQPSLPPPPRPPSIRIPSGQSIAPPQTHHRRAPTPAPPAPALSEFGAMISTSCQNYLDVLVRRPDAPRYVRREAGMLQQRDRALSPAVPGRARSVSQCRQGRGIA